MMSFLPVIPSTRINRLLFTLLLLHSVCLSGLKAQVLENFLIVELQPSILMAAETYFQSGVAYTSPALELNVLYAVTPQLALGPGITAITSFDTREFIVPVMLKTRMTLVDGKHRLFLRSGIGYSRSYKYLTNRNQWTGMVLSAGLQYSVPLSSHLALIGNLDYIQMEYTQMYDDYHIINWEESLNWIGTKLGISFSW